MYYRVNAPHVISETIDDETIIINLDSGAYYSTRGVANQIWKQLAQGESAARVLESALSQYRGERAEIETSIRQFLATLVEDALMVETEEGNSAFTPLAAAPTEPFVAPVLEKFTDMADLLLLDPIHEVDAAAGWPMPHR